VAAGEAAADPDKAGGPVDVAPAQRCQLTLAEAGHGRGEPERVVGRTEKIGASGAEERFELLAVEESDVRVTGR
jgi:hypothetical protein